jgi:hypothetical protein
MGTIGSDLVLETATGIMTGIVTRVSRDGVFVSLSEGSEALPCSVLEGPHGVPDYQPGDVLLIWTSGDTRLRVAIGRLSAADRARGRLQHEFDESERPDEVVIEARKSLTLRVGDGSITIREDGKILIKGKDLVSHAKRMNRIRGGSVAIN